MSTPGLKWFAILLGAVWLSSLACSVGQSDNSLRIGVMYPLSGSQAQGGREEMDGLKAALQVARQHHLPLADRVRLVVRDVQTPNDASAAVDAFAQAGIPVVMGTYGSTLSQAAAARADAHRLVFWETGAVADAVTAGRSYVFRTVATGSTLGRAAVDFTANVLVPADGAGRRTATIVAVDDLYGHSVSDEEIARARELGISVGAVVLYNPRAYDAKAVAAEVAAAHTDYLWDVSYLDDGLAIWQQLVRLGVHFKGAVGTSSAFCMPDFGLRAGRDAVGLFAADKPDDQVNRSALSPAAAALLDEARRAYIALHGGTAMDIPAIAGFVAGWALFHDVLPAVKGQVTPASVRQAALAVDVPMGDAINGGGVKFAPPGAADAGQNQRAVAVVGQWQAVNKMKVVYPPVFATAGSIIP